MACADNELNLMSENKSEEPSVTESSFKDILDKLPSGILDQFGSLMGGKENVKDKMSKFMEGQGQDKNQTEMLKQITKIMSSEGEGDQSQSQFNMMENVAKMMGEQNPEQGKMMDQIVKVMGSLKPEEGQTQSKTMEEITKIMENITPQNETPKMPEQITKFMENFLPKNGTTKDGSTNMMDSITKMMTNLTSKDGAPNMMDSITKMLNPDGKSNIMEQITKIMGLPTANTEDAPTYTIDDEDAIPCYPSTTVPEETVKEMSKEEPGKEMSKEETPKEETETIKEKTKEESLKIGDVSDALNKIKNNPEEMEKKMMESINNMTPDTMEKAKRMAMSGQGAQILKQMKKKGIDPRQMKDQFIAQKKAHDEANKIQNPKKILLITVSRQLKTKIISADTIESSAKDLLKTEDAIQLSCSRLAIGKLTNKTLNIWYDPKYIGKNKRASKILNLPIGGNLLIIMDEGDLTEQDFLSVETLLG